MTEPVGSSDRSQEPFEPRWLSVGEVIALHERQITRFGGPAGLRDEGLLDSALGRARNKWAYEGADLALLAAALGFGIVRNHPFVDGNKRTGFVALMLFLRKNGVRFAPPPAEATAIVLSLAAGEVSEAGLARWIRDRLPAVFPPK
jgi:death-on-curing protein